MQRRSFITTVAAALGTGVTAGCVANDPGGDPATGTVQNGSPDSTDSPEPTPSKTGDSLERRDACGGPDTASISAESNVVTVEGCIVGKNSCQVPALADATYDAEADELTVTVTTEKDSEADACTQQLVNLGYTATVEFQGGLPKTTTVIHNGAETDGQVAQAETN